MTLHTRRLETSDLKAGNKLKVRNIFILTALMCASVGEVEAMPSAGSSLGATLAQMGPPISQIRWFCYDRRNGRFIHWGRCRRPARHFPRVYCADRYGRFLHWGSCF
ncbi:MAG: hypothetical protein EKK29_07850 [Hyphomicrobiales bacterium]|nr:MAG: hypothetical protein EKK29_07850 [Hyphomicrobiales bacterium]